MELKLIEKHLGQNWYKWFLAVLLNSGFSRKRSATYEKDGVEVRVFKQRNTYQVIRLDGSKSCEMAFTFPHLTGKLDC